MKHYAIAKECWRELEKSGAGSELKMKLETRLLCLKRLLLENEARLYAVNSPCTIADLAQLRDMLTVWNNSGSKAVAVSEIEAHAMGLVRLLERE